MTITRLHPETLHQTAGYAHVTVVDRGRFAILAGQCPLDRGGRIVGRGDVLAQIDQVVDNATEALRVVGASAQDVFRSVIYVVSADTIVLSQVWDRLTASRLSAAFTASSTLLGVASLGYRDQLVEIEMTAALRE